jgi:hypothetical protein
LSASGSSFGCAGSVCFMHKRVQKAHTGSQQKTRQQYKQSDLCAHSESNIHEWYTHWEMIQALFLQQRMPCSGTFNSTANGSAAVWLNN